MSNEYGPRTVGWQGTNSSVSGGGPDPDVTLKAFAHEHRREALDYLFDAGGPVAVDDLYRRIVDAFGLDPEWTEPMTYVEIQFRHRHRPALEAAGLVEFDDEEETVAAADPSGDAAELLRQIRR